MITVPYMRRKFAAELFTIVAFLCLEQLPAHAFSKSDPWKRLNGVADGLYQQGDYQKAQLVWQRALMEAKQFGPVSRELATTYSNLAMVETSLGHPEAAISLHGKAVAMLETTTGKNSVATAAALVNEAECLRGLKHYSEAEQLYKTALPILEYAKESEQQDALLTMNNLALCYKNEGKLSEAEEAYKSVLKRTERLLRP